MKKVLFFLMMLIALCLTGTLQAQQTVTIGTGTSAGYYPIPGFYGWQYDVYIYTTADAQDLDDDFDVSQIAYDITSVNSSTGSQMTIWMKDVEPNFALTSSMTFTQLTTGATQVYDNTNFSAGTAGWNTYQFNQSFSHEGGKAILVAVRGTGCTTSGGCSRQCHYTSATGTHWYKHSDSSDPGTSSSGSIDGSRANIKLTVTASGTCPVPGNLVISNILSDGATLSWTPRGGATSWEVYCDTGDVDLTYVTGIPVGPDTFYSFTGLDPNTLYKAYVRSSCPGEYSAWRSVSFYTLCVPLTTLPLIENFDSYTGTTSTSASENNLPNCWSNISGTYSSYAGYPIIYNSSSYAASGSNAMRFYSGTTTSYNYGDEYAILPQVDVTYYPINTLQITMDVRKNSTSYADFTLYVGVMSDPTDPTTFEPVDTIVKSSTTYEEFTVMFNNYTGLGDFIALKSPRVTPSNVSYNTGYVDNLVLEPIPSCLKPTGVTLSNITATSVDVDWTPGDYEPAWEIVVVPAGTPVTSGLAEYATTHPYTVGNLDDNTRYDLYVRADCGGGDYSSWTQPQSFTTDPLCTPPSNLTISQVAGTSALVSWSPAFVGATNYTVEYSEAGMDMWTPEVVNGTSYMIPFLNPQTSYDVRVYSNCDLSSADTLTRTFSTGCLSGGDMNIGDGTNTSTSIPSYSFYKHGYSQQIFTASELGGANTFNSISFYMVNLAQQRNYKIYLMHTTATTSSDWLPTTNAQLVYSGPQTLVADSWNTFNFSTPFAYNGVDNLAVIVIDSNASYTSGNSWRVHNAPAGTGATKYTYNDGTAYSITSAPTTTNGGALAVRNNVIFGGDCDSLSTCVRPNLYIASKTDESITIDWAPGYMESSWDLEYSTDDTTWVSLGSLTSAPYTLDNLNANTVYYIRIRSNCGSDYSDWVKIHERTECGYVNIPLMEGFESAPGSGSGNMITCWSTNSNYTSTHYPYTSSSQHHNGTYSVYFYAGSSYYSYLITPRFDDNVMMNNLEVSFWAYKTSSTYYIQVGVMSNPEDPSTFVQIGQFSPSATSVWELFEVTTASYTGDGHYIAFRLPSDTTNYMYIDDINIDAIPTCQHVTNIHVDGTTLTGVSADILWTPGGTESEWEYVVAPANTVTNPENELSNTVYTAVAPLTGLVANTSYDIFVRANCAPGDNSRWEMYTFRTACDAITALPFVDNFDSYGVGSDVWIPCWKKFRTYTLSTTLPYVSGTSWGGTTGADGSVGYLYFYTATSGTYTMAVTPSFDPSIPINTLRAKFKYKRHNSNDEVIVGVISDITDSTTFVPVDTITVSTTDTWTDTHVDFSSYTGTGTYIAFMCMYHNNNTYSMIDNLSINTLPNCLEPNGFMVSSLDETSVSLTWNAGNENEWELYVVPAGSTLENVTPITLYDTSYTVTGLNSNTSYDAYLRAVCAGSGYSDYSITYFTTTCAAMDSLPFVENFDSHTGSTSGTTNNLPSCWNNISGSYSSYAGYPIIYNSSSSAASGSNSMRFYTGTTTSYAYGDEYAILPPIDAMMYPINTLQLTMDVRKGSTSYTDFTLIVGVMSNPSDANTFVPVDTIVRPDATYDEYTVYFSNYTGTGNFIALCAPKNTQNNVAYNTGYVDNIYLEEIPSCPRPNGLHVDAVTNSSITLSWNEIGSANSWEIEYGAPGFTLGSGTTVQATSNPMTVTGLQSSSNYEFYVRSVCSATDMSNWSNACVGATECDVTNVPYTEDFESYAGTTYSDNNGPVPLCWTNYGINTSYGHPHVIGSGSYHYTHSGNNCLVFTAGTTGNGTDAYAMMPSFSQALNTLEVSFYYAMESTSYGTLSVGYVTNTADPASTYVMLETVTSIAGGTNPMDSLTVDLSSYPGVPANGNICFLWNCTGSWYNCCIDDIAVDVAGSGPIVQPCEVPQGLTVANMDNTTATLTWTPNANVQYWTIDYKKTSANTWTTVNNITSPTYTLTNLNQITQYDVRLAAVCGDNNTSDYTPVVQFTTTNVGVNDYDMSTTLYPNPTTGEIRIQNTEFRIQSVEVYDVYGKLIKSVKVDDFSVVIDLSANASGVYFTRIMTDNGMVTKRVVKE